MVRKFILLVLVGLIQYSCGNHENVAKLDEQFVSQLQQERENKGKRSPVKFAVLLFFEKFNPDDGIYASLRQAEVGGRRRGIRI